MRCKSCAVFCMALSGSTNAWPMASSWTKYCRNGASAVQPHPTGQANHRNIFSSGPQRNPERSLAAHRLFVNAAFTGDDEVGFLQRILKTGDIQEIVYSLHQGCIQKPMQSGGHAAGRASMFNRRQVLAGLPEHDVTQFCEGGFQFFYDRSGCSFLRAENFCRAFFAQQGIFHVTKDGQGTMRYPLIQAGQINGFEVRQGLPAGSINFSRWHSENEPPAPAKCRCHHPPWRCRQSRW